MANDKRSIAQFESGSYRVTRPKGAKDVINLVREHGIQIVDLKFTDLPGLWQHFSIALPELDDELFDDGIGFDGSSIRGFQEIHESDMLLNRIRRPRSSIRCARCRRSRSSATWSIRSCKKPYTRDPRYVARKAERYLTHSGVADDLLLRAGARVLHLRLDPLRAECALRLLLRRLGRGRVELGPGRRRVRRRQPRLQAALQGGLFPGAAARHAAGHPLRDRARADEGRRPGRGAPPRGGDRRAERDRHALRTARAHGGQRDDVQVLRQEHRAPARQGGDLHAQAALRRQRERHALPPEPVERRQRTCSTTRRAMR